MRALIILAVIISCLLFTPLTGICLQNSKTDIEEIYQKQDPKSWGDIFSWVFNRKQFKKSYALVIGIGDYEKDWPKLEAPYYDALRIRDFLVNDAGFDYVITLTNAKATKQKINDLMEETFPSLLDDNDRFLFYFSGHGTQRPIGRVPLGYLVLQKCGMESYGSMINMEDIERWDRLFYFTRHVLFILDSCFSGLAGHQLKSPLTDKKLERLSQYSHHLITAGTTDEISVASLKKWRGSLFTDSFLKAVSGRADLRSRDFGVDGVVSLKELMKYVGDRIDDESVKLRSKNPLSKGIKMSPQISNLQDNAGEFFFITKHIKNRKVGNIGDKKLKHGWPLEVETKGKPPSPSSLDAERERLAEEWARIERERREIEHYAPTNPDGFFKRGRFYMGADKHDQAIADFTKAIELGYEPAWRVYANRGEAYRVKADFFLLDGGEFSRVKDSYIQAIKDVKKAIELNPKSEGWAYASLGGSYYSIGKFDQAILKFSEAIELGYPITWWAYAVRGACYLSKYEYDPAIKDLTKAIKLNPTYSWAYRKRALAYRMKGQYDRSRKDNMKADQVESNKD